MGIIDRASNVLRKQNAAKAAEAKRQREESLAYRHSEQRRCEEFIKQADLKKPFLTEIEDNIVKIFVKKGRAEKKLLVSLRFGWHSSSVYENAEYVGMSEPTAHTYIKYEEDFVPSNTQSYQHIKAGGWTDYYDYEGATAPIFLGEYLAKHGK